MITKIGGGKILFKVEGVTVSEAESSIEFNSTKQKITELENQEKKFSSVEFNNQVPSFGFKKVKNYEYRYIRWRTIRRY